MSDFIEIKREKVPARVMYRVGPGKVYADMRTEFGSPVPGELKICVGNAFLNEIKHIKTVTVGGGSKDRRDWPHVSECEPVASEDCYILVYFRPFHDREFEVEALHVPITEADLERKGPVKNILTNGKVPKSRSIPKKDSEGRKDIRKQHPPDSLEEGGQEVMLADGELERWWKEQNS